MVSINFFLMRLKISPKEALLKMDILVKDGDYILHLISHTIAGKVLYAVSDTTEKKNSNQ